MCPRVVVRSWNTLKASSFPASKLSIRWTSALQHLKSKRLSV
jgi:hypothetical protein